MVIEIDRRQEQVCVGRRGQDETVRLDEAHHDRRTKSLSTPRPDRLAGRLAKRQISKPEQRVIIEEPLARCLVLEEMVTEAAAFATAPRRRGARTRSIAVRPGSFPRGRGLRWQGR